MISYVFMCYRDNRISSCMYRIKNLHDLIRSFGVGYRWVRQPIMEGLLTRALRNATAGIVHRKVHWVYDDFCQ
jgi:hypothetical protein